MLVRHGQSWATVAQVAGGELGCRGLTELGIAQVEALARRLVATRELAQPTALLASTLPRAVQTAELLAPALGGLPVVRDRELCEMHPGEGDGLSWAQWVQRYGEFDLEAEPHRPLAPGGESWVDFEERVLRVLSRVVRDHAGGEVVVACHGGIIGGSLALLLGLPGQGPRRAVGEVRNSSITEWNVLVGPGSALRWSLVRFNDAAHLDPDGAPRRWA